MLRKWSDMARSLLTAWGGVPNLVFQGTRDIFVEVYSLNECHPQSTHIGL